MCSKSRIAFSISYEMPPKILIFLQKKSGITKNTLKTGLSGGKNLWFYPPEQRFGRPNKASGVQNPSSRRPNKAYGAQNPSSRSPERPSGAPDQGFGPPNSPSAALITLLWVPKTWDSIGCSPPFLSRSPARGESLYIYLQRQINI